MKTYLSSVAMLAMIWASPAAATESSLQNRGVYGDNGAAANTDVMTPRGTPRLINFEISEGTDISLDLSPDGRWIIFELLGHIYRIPAGGGTAECLTQGSGVALNLQPRFSPDGKSITFVSDRTGQQNVWVMNADGSAPRLVFGDKMTRFYDPDWSPDGRAIVAVRGAATPGRGWHRRNASIWLLPLDGRPQPLLTDTLRQYFAPSFSADGAHLYFHTSIMASRGYSVAQTGFRVMRRDMRSGLVEELPGRTSLQVPERGEAKGSWQAHYGEVNPATPAEFEARLSPNKRFLAFGRSAAGESIEYRGHRYAPATELVVRDMMQGSERVISRQIAKDLTDMHAIYSELHLPSFAWTPDSDAIFIAGDGGIRRVEVDTGKNTVIPFKADVRRWISEQVRGRVETVGSHFRSRFLQSPATSPDRHKIAFTAVGKVWLMDLPNGRPTPLPDTGAGFQHTPSWSPDGKELAFTTWDNANRGHVWLYRPSDGTTQRLTDKPGEYLHPVWTADGSSIAYVAGGENPPDPKTNPWQATQGWNIRLHDLSNRRAKKIADVQLPEPIAIGTGGRVFFTHVEDPQAAKDLMAPYPLPEAERQYVTLTSVQLDGNDRRVELRFPPRQLAMTELASPLNPILSPDGTWVAYQADYRIYVEKAEPVRTAGVVDNNPNIERTGRIRADEKGGVDPRWLDANTLEYASGDTLVRYNVSRGTRTIVAPVVEVERAVPRGKLALRGATLIFPGKTPAAVVGDILIDGARIACAGTCDLTKADKLVDISGKFVIPGFVDAHSHILAERAPVIAPYRGLSAIALAYGVTTVIDPAVPSESLFEIGELTEAGRIVGPRSVGSAETVVESALGSGGSATATGPLVSIDTPEDAQYHVDRRADWGAVTIKNFRQGRREQHQLLLDAARRRGVSVTGEGGYASFDLGLAMDGQTGWEHSIPNIPLRQDLAKFLGAAEVTYSPTAIIAGHLAGSNAYFRPQSELLKEVRHLRFLPRSAIEESVVLTPERKELTRFSFPLIAEGLADIVRNGGFGAIGEHGEQPGLGSHWELWAYAKALTPGEALRVATLDGARFVGLERETGSIDVGKFADLVILNSSPLLDIRNSADILYVLKAGNMFEAMTLKPVWHAQTPLADLARANKITAD